MTPDEEKRGYVIAQVVMVVLFLIAAFVIAVFVPGDAKTKLTMSIGYGLLVLTFLFGMVILVDIIRGHIDLSTLLTEEGKGASMSRFQLLIFTFVIALSLFLLVVENGKEFPKIPADVLTLLGISASTYAVSKGIQAGKNGNKAAESGAAAGAPAGAAAGAKTGAAAGPATGAATGALMGAAAGSASAEDNNG
jgi:hypothetical protein